MPATSLGIINRASQKSQVVEAVQQATDTDDSMLSTTKNQIVNIVSALFVALSIVMSTIFLIDIV